MLACRRGGWTATQHIDNATVQGHFTLSGGASLSTESFVAAPATAATSEISFLVTKITVSGAAAVTLNISTSPRGPGAAGGAVESWGSAALASTPAPKDGIRAGKGINVAFATRVLGAETAASVVELAAGSSMIVVTAVASDIDTDGADPAAAVKAAVQAATPTSVAAMETAHVAWWSTYWARSQISLPTQPLVERFWYMSQYTIGSSVRWNGAGSSAPGGKPSEPHKQPTTRRRL